MSCWRGRCAMPRACDQRVSVSCVACRIARVRRSIPGRDSLRLQKLLKYVIRDQPATRREPDPFAVEGQQSIVHQPFRCLHRRHDQSHGQIPARARPRRRRHSCAGPETTPPRAGERARAMLLGRPGPARYSFRSPVVVARSTYVGPATAPGAPSLPRFFFCGKGGIAPKHRRRIQPHAQIRPPLPIAQVVPRLESRPREIGNLVLAQSRFPKPLDGPLIHPRNRIVARHEIGVIARSTLKHLAPQARILVHFQHVHAGVRNARTEQAPPATLPTRQTSARPSPRSNPRSGS